MTDQRNLILAIALSVAIIVGFELVHTFLAPPPVAVTAPAPVAGEEAAPGSGGVTMRPPSERVGGSGDVAAGTALATRTAALAREHRIAFAAPRVAGSIALRGARL
ncbi:MAG: membrane protein insertase YidC, partial [Alphaproteobacteria bacterium]|nr:membrane protein insertase YidC [Alphaproteobacteria bacterium]